MKVKTKMADMDDSSTLFSHIIGDMKVASIIGFLQIFSAILFL